MHTSQAAILGLSADTAINLILLFVCIGFVLATVLVLATNREQRRLADWLNARADARDFFMKRYAAYRLKRESNIVIHGEGAMDDQPLA